jgi:hypothetical protein
VLGFPARREIGDCFIWGTWGGGGAADDARASADGPPRQAVGSPHPVLLHNTHTLDVIQVGGRGGGAWAPLACSRGQLEMPPLCAKRVARMLSLLAEPPAFLLPHTRSPQVAAGGTPGAQHAALLTRGGEVYTWGSGVGGKLGHGTSSSVAAPQQVLRLFGKGAVAVACGHTYTGAVLRDGGLFTWGTGLGGQLGLGDTAAPTAVYPTRVPLGRTPGSPVRVEQLSCGPYHLAAVSREGVLFTWGDGLFGKLGHGSQDSCASPRVVEALRGSWVVGVAAGWWHTAAVAVPREEVARRRTASRSGASGSSGDDDGSPHGSSPPSSRRNVSPYSWPPPAPAAPAWGASSGSSTSSGSGARVASIGGALFTWGGDFTWSLRGRRDHHCGCLGHGDLAGRLVPTQVLGEDDVRQVRGAEAGAAVGRKVGQSAPPAATCSPHRALSAPVTPAPATARPRAAPRPRRSCAAATSRWRSTASARCCRWAPPARSTTRSTRRCGRARACPSSSAARSRVRARGGPGLRARGAHQLLGCRGKERGCRLWGSQRRAACRAPACPHAPPRPPGPATPHPTAAAPGQACAPRWWRRASRTSSSPAPCAAPAAAATRRSRSPTAPAPRGTGASRGRAPTRLRAASSRGGATATASWARRCRGTLTCRSLWWA